MSTPSERLEEARAQRVRIARETHELKNAHIALRDVLGSAQHVLGSASIEYVLRHVPGLGVKGTQKVLKEASCRDTRNRERLYPWRRAGSLTNAEVQAIMRCLPPRVHKYQPN